MRKDAVDLIETVREMAEKPEQWTAPILRTTLQNCATLIENQEKLIDALKKERDKDGHHIHFHCPPGSRLAADGDSVLIEPCELTIPAPVEHAPLPEIILEAGKKYRDQNGAVWALVKFQDLQRMYIEDTFTGRSGSMLRTFKQGGECLDTIGYGGNLVEEVQ